MKKLTILAALPLLAACAVRSSSPGVPASFTVPASVHVVEGRTGAPVTAGELLRRVRAADVVLLGEVHDNAVIHEVRGALIAAARDLRPAIVFEQFAETHEPIVPPATGEDLVPWLDRSGFDREGWKWPLHRPVVEAALQHARSVWGSGLSRELLRSVVRTGESAAPSHLRPLLEQVPLTSAAQAALDRELVDSHCGQLPESMIPGMRAAQTARDASMASALARAAASGRAWLIAGNGHVRSDLAVPRLLETTVPGKSVLVVGFLERSAAGEPDAASRSLYDIVVVSPRVDRPDPCASFRR